MSERPLKCPFPYFGGKSRVAALVWKCLGDVSNFIEPFCGSAAVLLARPHAPRVETVNDADCYVANFWRATSRDPEAVAEHADGPVNEADLHSRHRWLVLSEEAATFRERMRTDPDYHDARIAGWWCWGLCCWIGGGWCAIPEACGRVPAQEPGRRPKIDEGAHFGNGVHAKRPATQQRRPIIANPGSDAGKGVHGNPPAKRPRAHRAAGSSKSPCNLPGVLAEGLGAESSRLSQQTPRAIGGQNGSPGVPSTPGNGGRPQLADTYARGRGVHGNDAAGTCAQRRAWLLDWFDRLRDRLRTVRVCCGHWLRVCDSESVTTRLGTTGLFLDPPYPTHEADGTKSRAGGLYATDGSATDLDQLRNEVLAYCLERGPNPAMRICVAGYDTDGYAALEHEGWEVVAWKSQGGYGNRSRKGKANAGRERLWFSPGCQTERTLFDEQDG